jgi:SAM-dependent methyltransferase
MTEIQHRPCPACKKRDAIHFGEKNGFEIFGCRLCRSTFTDRVPKDEEDENYDDYYTESNLKVPDFIKDRLNTILSDFEPYRETNRLLDIGFGAGTMLDVAKDLGWEVYGLEVSRPAVEQARAKGFDVFHGSLKDSGHPLHYFDVVTASEILEHLPNPERDLKEIVRILRPGGLFWATTPSARAISFRLMKLDWSIMSPPEHIQLYSIAGARVMLEEAGFGRMRFKTYGVNPYEIRQFYLGGAEQDKAFSRVNTSYELNESFMKSLGRRFIKNTLNEVLNVFGLGDSLKIFAETPR